jgi:diguanylate cyclase (GGDEF)-like protein/PAS domain S-box-containing protein
MNHQQAGSHGHAALSADAALRAVIERISGSSGGEFYRRLASGLGSVFGACYAGVGEMSLDGVRLSLRGAWSRDTQTLPGDFNIAATPAEEVARGELRIYRERVRRDFPADQRLQRMLAEGYLGVPIADARGDVLGLIELISDRPLEDTDAATAIVMAMAERAAAEMERDQAEAALRDSEMRYRALIEDSFHLVAEVVDERFIYASSGYTDTLGYPPEDLLGGSIFELIHEEDRKPAAGELQATLSQRRAARFTVRMRHAHGGWRWVECTARAFRATGGEFRTTLFSRDVTDRLQAEEALRESEELFRTLIKDLRVGVALHDADARVLVCNDAALSLLGLTEEELLGKTSYDEAWKPTYEDGTVVPPEQRPVPRAIATGAPVRDVVYGVRRPATREQVWVLASAEPQFDAEGRVHRVICSLIDITARLTAERELRASEARFRFLAENSMDVIARFDAQGRCVWISPSVTALTGYAPEEVVGQSLGDLLRDDPGLLAGALANVREGIESFRTTFQLQHKDGRRVWMEATNKVVRDPESQELIEIQTSARDITARKRVEDELRESEERFRLLAENSTDVIGRFSPDGRCVWISPSAAPITGYTPQEIMQTPPQEFVHPDDALVVWDAFTAMLEDGGPRRTTFRFQHKDGHYIWLEASSRAIRDRDGRVLEIHSATRDVTERMAAQEELRESEARFRLLAENATDVIGRFTPEGVCLWVAPSVRTIMGYEPAELIGANAWDRIHPDDLPALARPEGWQRPDSMTSILRYQHKDGHWVWIESVSKAIRDPRTGDVIELHNTSRDVTARKAAEDELRESEARYRSLSESSPLGVFETTADGAATYFNERAIQMAGMGGDELKGWGWLRHAHPDDRPIVEAAWRAATQDGRECAIEYRLQTPRGTIWVSSQAIPVRLPDGTVEKYVGTIDNVTERREAQEALRGSEQLFRATLESTADGIIVTRPNTELLYWNNRAAEMLSIPQSVLDGRSVSEFARYLMDGVEQPEAMREAFSSLPTDEPVHTGTWAGRNGRMFEAFAHPLRDPSGDLLRVWSIREVTEKHQAEKALRESEARFRSLAEHTTELVLGIRGPGIIDYVSPNARTILGYAPEIMAGMNALDFVDPDALPYIIEDFERAAATSGQVSVMLRVRTGWGEWRWFEATTNFYRANTGEERAVVTARDVTARVLAEDALRESQERLRAVVNSAPLALIAVDRDEKIVLAEGQGLAMLRGATGPLAGQSIADRLDRHPEILAEMRRALAGEEVAMTAVFDRLVFEAHFRPLFDEHGRPNGMIGVAFDVSARVEAERLLRDSEETARALLNAPTDGAVLVDREGAILAMNETAERRFGEHAAKQGVEPRDFIGTCVFDIFPPDLRSQRRARNEEVFQNGQRRHFEDERDGVWTDVTIDPIKDPRGNVMRLAIFSRDITDRKRDEAALRKRSRELQALNDYLEKTSAELERSQEELREASEQLADLLEAEQARSKTDTLTGALNHGAISEAIAEAVAADVALAVAMIDVDGMKTVNDTYGHQAGDQVLLAVAQAISRGGAITGRYGGDEFVVALLNAGRDEARVYKDAVEAALRGASVVDPESGARVPVVASVGIALYPEDGDTFKTLVERADERMYEEKKAHKGTGTGLSPSRTMGDERASRMVGELVPLLTSAGTLDDKLRLVAHRLSVGAGYAGVSFDVMGEQDGQTATLHQNAFTRAPEDVIEAWNRHQRAGSNARVGMLLYRTRRPVIIDDIAASGLVTDQQKGLLRSMGIVSAIVVPVFDGDTMVATMSVGCKQPAGFGQNDVQFLTSVAGQVSAIIRMARLVEELGRATHRLEEARDETVMLLAEAAEAHTQNASGHFLATRAVAEALAVEMGWDEARVRELGQAAALHDIGKIHLPDALLSSPEPFSPRRGVEPAGPEWESLQQHCVRGRDFLARSKGFDLAAMVAYTHHERWDGGGYPQGLAGEAIPVEAVIIAVADSLDAMMTESPYQSRRTFDGAIAEIRACSGTQFRPEVVDALGRLYDRGALRDLWSQDGDAAAA